MLVADAVPNLANYAVFDALLNSHSAVVKVRLIPCNSLSTRSKSFMSSISTPIPEIRASHGCYITTLMDERILEEYNENHPETTIDLEAFWRGEIVITGWDSLFFESPHF